MENKDNELWNNTRKTIVRHESWRYYWTFLSIGLGIGAICFYFYHQYPSLVRYIGGLAFGFWGFHFCLRSWWIFSSAYKIDADQLIIRTGVLFRTYKQISLLDIVDISMIQSKKEKMLRVGSLEIKLKSGEDPCIIYGITDPDDIKEHIVKVQTSLAKQQLPFMGGK